jgi:hypothetical protein
MNFKLVSTIAGFALMLGSASYGQNDEKPKAKPKKQDQIILDFNSNLLLNSPTAPKWFSRGFSFSLMNDFIIGKSNFSFGAGLGLNTENYFFTNSAVLTTTFEGISDIVAPSEFVNYSNYKLGLTTVELPLEFRFRSQPSKRKTFKFAVGGKIGYVIQSKTKESGTFTVGETENDFKAKNFRVDNINPIRYGLHARIGYARYALTAYYGLNTVFEKDRGPEMNQLNIGFTFMPF